LAIANVALAQDAVDKGNVFIARDRLFRQHRQEGLSAIVLQSDDASADHLAYQTAGFSGGEMLQFSRPVRLPDGQETTSSFSLAFAVKKAEENLFVFACQRVNPLPSDRAALERHVNGVLGLKRVLIQSDAQANYAPWMASVFGTSGRTITNGIAYDTQNLSVEITGCLSAQAGLLAIGLVFAVSDLEVTAAALAANGVDHVKTSDGIVVPAAPGQGVAFLFEENAS
jgi:Glyoxalase-like domain